MDCGVQDDDVLYKRRKNMLRKTVSSVGFSPQYTTFDVREAKSFTGALDELKHLGQNKIEQGLVCHRRGKDGKCEQGCVTTEIFSNQIFVVTEDMLNHRGKSYTMNDIAIRWKKDCRMWLWKSRAKRKSQMIFELREQLHSLKIPNSNFACANTVN